MSGKNSEKNNSNWFDSDSHNQDSAIASILITRDQVKIISTSILSLKS